jgi:hypothetical protein
MMRKALDGDPARRDKILSRTPANCFGQPEDIGQAAVYLASPAAKFITGACLPVNAVPHISSSTWWITLTRAPRPAISPSAADVVAVGDKRAIGSTCGQLTNWARGGAGGVGMDGVVDNEPMLDGMIWNMTFDTNAKGTAERTRITTEELWQRLSYFLDAMLPTAEKAGVMLAAHPDDPPVERIRDTPRLVIRPELYQKLIDLHPSPANGLRCPLACWHGPRNGLHDGFAAIGITIGG